MKKIIAFGASNSKESINKALATWASSQVKDAEATVLDLNDYQLPIYSIDIENESGIPAAATQFQNDIADADGILISFAEHNGNFTAAFKNLYDWLSRASRSVWNDKRCYYYPHHLDQEVELEH